MTPLRFKTVQNHCVPWPLPASRCIAIASRPKANPLRAFAARLEAPPSLALAFLCAATLYFSIPLLYRALLHSALPNCTLPCLTALCPCLASLISAFPLLFRAHRGDSFRCPAIACHCFSILRLHYAKHLPAAPLQHHASLHFSIALPRYASPREASAVLLVPKQNSAYPMQFLAVRRSTSPLLRLALPRFSFAVRRPAPRTCAAASLGGPISPPFPPGRSSPPASCNRISLPCRRGCCLPRRASCR